MIRLICMDLDGVIFQPVNFWMELHAVLGTLDEGKELTAKYLKTDYERLVNEVLGRLWKGKDAAAYYDLVNAIQYAPGVQEFFLTLNEFTNEKGIPVPRAIISSGSYDLALRAQKEFNIDFLFANQPVIRNGAFTGEFLWPMAGGHETKAAAIQTLCDDMEILPQEVLMIGNDSTDIEAFQVSGISIAFNTDSDTLKKAATFIVDSSTLHEVIPILEQLR